MLEFVNGNIHISHLAYVKMSYHAQFHGQLNILFMEMISMLEILKIRSYQTSSKFECYRKA